MSSHSVARLIDVFLADAKAMGERVPTNDELARARQFLRHLEASTREDHLKSVDEVLSHAPRELLMKAKQLQVGAPRPGRGAEAVMSRCDPARPRVLACRADACAVCSTHLVPRRF